MGLDKERYRAHLNLAEIGEHGQEILLGKTVSVVGVGGLGCHVLIQLSQLGVGEIILIDDDVIEISNLQRQSLFYSSDIGKNKTDIAEQRLKDRNDSVRIISHCERLTKKTCNNLLKGSDIVVDCTDSIASRMVIDDFCNKNKTPMVYGGVRGFEGSVSVFNYLDGKSFRDTFPDHKTLLQNEDCADSGVVASIVSVTASLQMNEVLKILLGLPNVLQGKLQVFNLLNNSFRVLDLK